MSRLLMAALFWGVCVCAWCARVCSAEQRDYGVKLCGREFIRAVIFTCGGSRWRRSAHPGPAYDPNLLISYRSSSERGDDMSWLKSSRVATPDQSSFLPISSSSSSSSPPSLSNLLQAMGAQSDSRDETSPPEEAQRSWMKSLFSSGPAGGKLFGSLDLNRQDRRRRNFSLGLAGLCCNQGCTKNDIGRLC